MQALRILAERYPQKRVLITGATSGMGESLALVFAGAGFRLPVARPLYRHRLLVFDDGK